MSNPLPNQSVDRWQSALQDAYMLAHGERLAEIRGDRRAKWLDGRGLHPFSALWGEIVALESVEPVLKYAREQSGESACDPVTLRQVAHRDAELAFDGRWAA